MGSGVSFVPYRCRLFRGAPALLAVALLVLIGRPLVSPPTSPTVAARFAQLGLQVHDRLAGVFAAARLDYPPRYLLYVALKQERRLEVYARSAQTDAWQHVLDYPIRDLSGTLGPKRAQGDEQVPEGLYRVQALNADSRFHLALRLDYPNAADRSLAQSEGRSALGGDIMIHGEGRSTGCLSLTNEAIEDLFVLTALAADAAPAVWISPVDFRRYRLAPVPVGKLAEPQRYRRLADGLRSLHRPGLASGTPLGND